VYLVLASGLFFHAVFLPSVEGGEWFVMYFIYWPASCLVYQFRGILKGILTTQFLHHFPASNLSWLNIFDGVNCVLVGAIWYFVIVKSFHFFIKKRKIAISQSSDRVGDLTGNDKTAH